MAMPGERRENEAPVERPPQPTLAPVGGGAPHPEQGTASLSFYLEAISQGRWLIVGALLVAALWLGLGARQRRLLVYEADVLLQVESQPQKAAPAWAANIEGALSGPAEPGGHGDRGDAVAAAPGRGGGQRSTSTSRRRPGTSPRSVAPSRYAGGGRRSPRRSWGSTSTPGVANGSRSRASTSPRSIEDATLTLTMVPSRPAKLTLLNDVAGGPSPWGPWGSPSPGTCPPRRGRARPPSSSRNSSARPGTEFTVAEGLPGPGRQGAGRIPSSSPRRGSSPASSGSR